MTLRSDLLQKGKELEIVVRSETTKKKEENIDGGTRVNRGLAKNHLTNKFDCPLF